MSVMMLYSYIKFWNPDWVREMTGCPETTKGVGVADHNCTKCNQIYMYMPMTLYTGSSTGMPPLNHGNLTENSLRFDGKNYRGFAGFGGDSEAAGAVYRLSQTADVSVRALRALERVRAPHTAAQKLD